MKKTIKAIITLSLVFLASCSSNLKKENMNQDLRDLVKENRIYKEQIYLR